MATNVSPEKRHELIAKKAEELFMKRGQTPGHELDDWLEAERLVDQELQARPREPQIRSEPVARPAPAPVRSTTATKSGPFRRFTG